jgi:hypothetical protein
VKGFVFAAVATTLHHWSDKPKKPLSWGISSSQVTDTAVAAFRFCWLFSNSQDIVAAFR